MELHFTTPGTTFCGMHCVIASALIASGVGVYAAVWTCITFMNPSESQSELNWGTSPGSRPSTSPGCLSFAHVLWVSVWSVLAGRTHISKFLMSWCPHGAPSLKQRWPCAG